MSADALQTLGLTAGCDEQDAVLDRGMNGSLTSGAPIEPDSSPQPKQIRTTAAPQGE